MTGEQTKHCPRCGLDKPLDGFYPDRGKSDGRRYICRPCDRLEANARYRARATTQRPLSAKASVAINGEKDRTQTPIL
jgi:hypothetical protein